MSPRASARMKIRFQRGDWRRRHPCAGGRARARRRAARADGRLQPGLAHAVGYAGALEPEGRADRSAGAGAARRVLDGRAAAPRRPRRDEGAARGHGGAHRRRRDDARAPRAPRSDHQRLASTCCSRMRLWSAASPGCGGLRQWRRSISSSSRRIPGPTAWDSRPTPTWSPGWPTRHSSSTPTTRRSGRSSGGIS